LDWRHGRRLLDEAFITSAMMLVVFGMICLWLGMRSGLGRRVSPKHLPEVSGKRFNVAYLQIILIVGTAMSTFQSILTVGGEGFRQVVLIMEGAVSMTATVILLWRAMEGKAVGFEKLFVWTVVGARVLLGVSSGWMGSAVALALTCAFLYLKVRHKLPITALACLVPYVLFFQAGKQEFRKVFWQEQVQASTLEKVGFWLDASLKIWQQALTDPSGRGVPSLLSYSLARTSLLTQAANVIEQTPGNVPYQYGRLYSYLAVSLIPRFVWPDKPSMNEANQFYQVAYGLTRERDLEKSSIAVGSLTEGYINFGWFGTALVMFLIGVLLDFWNETFLNKKNALLAGAVGIALLPQLLVVEGQLAQYLSGIIQQMLLTAVVFIPVMRWKRRRAITTAGHREYGMASVRS
jgi:hypothetical protein